MLTFSASTLLRSTTVVEGTGYVRFSALAVGGGFAALIAFDCVSFMTGRGLVFVASFPPVPVIARARVLLEGLGDESKLTISFDMGIGEDFRPCLPYFLTVTARVGAGEKVGATSTRALLGAGPSFW